MVAKSFSLATRLTLSNGTLMPQIHLGVYMMSGQEAYRATLCALQAGYRGFDSAQMYRNEKSVGQAINDFLNDKSKNIEGLTREDIFYTSKLASNSSFETTKKSIERSVITCGLGYIDLFLLHSPYGGREARISSWKAVQDAVTTGSVRIAGVSNFGQKHLEELMAIGETPVINQIEVHPFNTRAELTSFCQSNGIVVEAYAPLARALRFKHPVVVEMSEKYSCTPAQLLIRWSLQHGYVPLPKSVTRTRIQANGQIDFFEIDQSDMQRLDGLDEVLVTDWDPLDAD